MEGPARPALADRRGVEAEDLECVPVAHLGGREHELNGPRFAFAEHDGLRKEAVRERASALAELAGRGRQEARHMARPRDDHRLVEPVVAEERQRLDAVAGLERERVGERGEHAATDERVRRRARVGAARHLRGVHPEALPLPGVGRQIHAPAGLPAFRAEKLTGSPGRRARPGCSASAGAPDVLCAATAARRRPCPHRGPSSPGPSASGGAELHEHVDPSSARARTPDSNRTGSRT